MKFEGSITMPHGGVFTFHEIRRLTVDLQNERFLLDITSWPTRRSYDDRYQGDARIAVVEFGLVPTVDQTLQSIIAALVGAGGPLEGAAQASPDDSLPELKRRKRLELASAWKLAQRSGVTLGSKTAPTAPDDLVDYLLLRHAATDNDWVDQPIQLVDGSFEVMTPSKVQQLWSVLKAHRHTLAVRLRDKIALVQAADTAEEVAAVVW